MTSLVLSVLVASAAAFALALLSAVAGFGGGVVLLPVFTVLFGLRVAVPMLTLTQLSSNGSRAWLNRSELRRPLIGWFTPSVPFPAPSPAGCFSRTLRSPHSSACPGAF